MSGSFHRLLPLADPRVAADGCAGAKAARLGAALRAGFPVLPGWVAPLAEARPALRAGAAEVTAGRPAAARRAVLTHPVDLELAGELGEAVRRLGGRAIVRSSSSLESDPLWSGALTSVAEVRPADVDKAVRSCWSSAFAVDPLERLAACGLPLSALEVGVLIQPEIVPTAGGVARAACPRAQAGAAPEPPVDPKVIVEGVRGHPGALMSGWEDGASGQALAHLLGADGAGVVTRVARLAAAVHREMGDDIVEWAAVGSRVYLLQTLRSATAAPGAGGRPVPASRPGGATEDLVASRERMPLLAAVVQARGQHLAGRPGAPGTAAGRLVAVRPHERPGAACRDAILLVDRPAPALAPLLFAARGVIARAGAAGSHLAEVARSLAVPMVIGCRPELAARPPAIDGSWLAAVNGSTGDVAVLQGPGQG